MEWVLGGGRRGEGGAEGGFGRPPAGAGSGSSLCLLGRCAPCGDAASIPDADERTAVWSFRGGRRARGVLGGLTEGAERGGVKGILRIPGAPRER